jgi:transcription elongation GreA/GreB family factor
MAQSHVQERPTSVRVGTRVTVEFRGDPLQLTWTIVPVGDGNFAEDTMSADAPLARAIMHRAVEDKAMVDTPLGRRECTILHIEWAELVTAAAAS